MSNFPSEVKCAGCGWPECHCLCVSDEFRSDKIDLVKLRELCDAATPGPWEYDAPENMICDSGLMLIAQPRSTELGKEARDANGPYIAAANPVTLRALLDRLERAESELASARQVGKHMFNEIAGGTVKAWNGELPDFDEVEYSGRVYEQLGNDNYENRFKPAIEAWCRAAIGAALEAADQACRKVAWDVANEGDTEQEDGANKCREAIRALDKLAPAPQAKPVAWAAFADNGNIRVWTSAPDDVRKLAESVGVELVPLYTRAAPQAEPVPATDELSDLDQENLRIGQEIQRAALTLPDGWNLEVNVERGAGGVELYDDNGVRREELDAADTDGLSFAISKAIDAAQQSPGTAAPSGMGGKSDE